MQPAMRTPSDVDVWKSFAATTFRQRKRLSFSTQQRMPMTRHPRLPSESALGAIGNTPVVKLRRVVPEGSASVYVKLEYFNPTGSYKDRMAKTMIEQAEARGTLKPGMTVVEASGGSTGSSLAFVCAVKGYRFRIVSSNAFAQEKLKTMAAFGAEVELTHSPSGKISANLIPSMIQRSKEIANEEDC